MLSKIKDDLDKYFFNSDIINFTVSNIFGDTFQPIIYTIVNDMMIPITAALFLRFPGNFLKFNFLGKEIFIGKLLSEIIVFVFSSVILYFLFIVPLKDNIEKKARKEEIEREKRESKINSYIRDIKNAVVSINKFTKNNTPEAYV